MLDLEINDERVKFKNPNTEGFLEIPFLLISGLEHDYVKNNLVSNLSHRPWLNRCEVRKDIAVLCGNGPSLKDSIEEIKSLGGVVLACNGAARFLCQSGVEVDYQVMMDADPIMVNDVGHAKNYLFASCMNPQVFEKRPEAVLWHPDSEWIEKLIPKDRPDFTFIGGEICVGLYALSICHVLGFREVHVFGMDASYTETTHSNKNQEENMIINVRLGDKVYKTSFDMKEQARCFLARKELLEKHGCKVVVHGSGLLPDLVNLNTKEN